MSAWDVAATMVTATATITGVTEEQVAATVSLVRRRIPESDQPVVFSMLFDEPHLSANAQKDLHNIQPAGTAAPPITDGFRQQVLYLRASGLKLPQIAKQLDVTLTRVRSAVYKRHGGER